MTSIEEPEVKVQPHDDSPIGEERGKIKLESRQAVSENTAARLRATLFNAVSEKQDTHTGPYGLVKSKSIHLSSPKPGHTTGGSGRGARRDGGAGSGRTVRPGDKRPSYPPKHRRHVA